MKMHAMVLNQPGEPPQYTDVPIPKPNSNQVLIKVYACGICRTDLHVVDGELTHPNLPIIPGHQIVGRIVELGNNVNNLKVGQRIGVPWLGETCGTCEFCLNHQENLCDNAKFTGYQINGGFAEYCVADKNYCFPLPYDYNDYQVAPLLCAGFISYRALNKIGKGKRLGIYGFGSAAHIVIQTAKYQGREVYAFTRKGDTITQEFARKLGAVWAGNSCDMPPKPLDAAIIFAPAGELIPAALRALKKGGIAVCSGIHMSDIPSFPYETLWGERSITSVANLTRQDGDLFLALAPKIPIKTEVHLYPLNKTNEALNDLRQGKFTGAAVIDINL